MIYGFLARKNSKWLAKELLREFNKSFEEDISKNHKTWKQLQKEALEELEKDIILIKPEDLIVKSFKEEERMGKYLTKKECLELNGKKVTCEIQGEVIKDAEIVVDGDYVSIAQNVKDGTGMRAGGYKYSWVWDGDTKKVQLKHQYKYLDIKVPEWYDGRPVFGFYSDTNIVELRKTNQGYCVGILPDGQFLVVDDEEDYEPIIWKYFIPEEQKEKKCILTIEENGEERKVILTKEQMKDLGLL